MSRTRRCFYIQSATLQYVDASLDRAFAGQRCIEDTIILDMRPYRSDRIRKQQEGDQCHREDEEAYKGFRRNSGSFVS